LLPLGWLKALVAGLRFRRPPVARVALMGVRQKFHTSTLTMGTRVRLIEAVRASSATHGMRYAGEWLGARRTDFALCA